MEFYEELSRYFFIVNLVVAGVLFRAPHFTGKNWLVLAFLAWGLHGLFWFLSPELMYYDGPGAALNPILNLTGMVALVIGVFSWAGHKGGIRGLAGGARGGDLESDQATSMIARNDSNSISRAEAVRDEIYDHFCRACEEEQISAEVFRSPPYSPTIWVEVRVQEPIVGEEDLSLRATATVTIEPREFHRFDHEMTIALNDSKKKKSYWCVTEVTRDDAVAICRYLANKTRTLSIRPRRCRRFPWELWRPKNKLVRLKPNWSVAAILAVAGLVLVGIPVLGVALLVAAFIAWLFERERRRRIFSLTCGKPRQEPRILLRMDSWQTVLYDLAPHAEELAGKIRSGLRGESVPATDAGAERAERFDVSEEDVWYLGIDGKVERRQIVVRLRRAIGFVHVYTYGNDLYVGWDANINGGTWIEKRVGEGREPKSGMIVRAYGIDSAWHTPNEYDITDANVLLESIHSVITKVIKRALKEHEVDQEIDFTIVRESRQGIAGREKPKTGKEFEKKKPRLRRVA